MRKSILSKVVILFLVITVGLIWSCVEDKPGIFIPEPPQETPQDINPVEAIAPDTIIFKTNDSIVIKLKTNPYYLLEKEGVSVGLCTPDSTDYDKAEICDPQLNRKDSIWNITIVFKPGISNGDKVCVKVTEDAKTMLSKPIVLKKFSYHITTFAPDTVTFMPRDTLVVGLKSTPFNWLDKEGVSVQLSTPDGEDFENAEIKSMKMGSDSIWNIVMQLKTEARTGDAISIKVSDCDTVIFTKPIFLKKFIFGTEVFAPDTITFMSRDTLVVGLRSTPFNWLSMDDVSVQISNPDGQEYKNAYIKSMELGNDSVWSIVMQLKKEARTGDVISIKVSDLDTVIFTKPIFLKKFVFDLETLSPDTVVFNEGDYAILNMRTTPVDLLTRENVEIKLFDKSGRPYELATVNKLSLSDDNIWSVYLRMEYGMKSGDVIVAKIDYKDTLLSSAPIVLKMIPKPEPIHYALNIISDPISAYEAGGQATVYFRTTPWNLLLKDANATFSITDTLGNQADNLFNLDSRVFMPDSSWQIKVTVKDPDISSSFMAAKITNSDTTLLSTPVELKKVSFGMQSVRTGNNLLMNYNSENSTYTYYLPEITDLKSQGFLFKHNGHKVIYEDNVLTENQYNTIDASKPFTVSVWCYDLHKEYTIKVAFCYVNIISDVVSAYEGSNTATVRLRTVPWNILQNNADASLTLTDSLGNPVNDKISISSKEFTSDSCWTYKLKVLNGSVSSSMISFALSIPDTTVHSSTVELKKVSFGMQSVWTGNDLLMNYNNQSNTYSYYLPEVIDLSSQGFMFKHNGHKVTFDDNVLTEEQYNTIDASKPFTVSVWCYDLHKEYTIKIAFCNVNIISDIISAYEGSNTATVRLRTLPWNILQTDANATLTLTDSLGNPVEDKISIQSKEFMPDSSWTYKLKVLNSSVSSSVITFALSIPDTTVISSRVELKKVTITMKSVKMGVTKTMSFDNVNTFSYFLPAVTDFSAQKFKFNHNGDKVTVGDSVLLEDDYNVLDVSKPLTVSVWKYDAHKDYIIRLYNTGLPVVRINTNGQNITSRKDWVSNISMRIEYPDGTVDYEGTLQMRGRGNGTWIEGNDFSVPAKKPYALKLDEKAKLLGMHKDKRWILLANYKDRTLLRNDAAYWLSRQTYNPETGDGLPYTVNGQYVELVWNGVHKGNYYLCEQIKIDDTKLDIADPDLENPQNGGIFLEIDTYYNYYTNHAYPKKEELGFKSDYFKVPYIFKDPDESMINTSSNTYTYVKNYINKLEGIIMDDTKLKNREYLEYLDIDKAIDFLLIQELTMNNDSYNTWPSNGPHSTFMYMDSCGKLCFGPVWDFDYHTFTLYEEQQNWGSSSLVQSSRLNQWELLSLSNKGNGHYYFDRLKGDPEFKRRLIDRWDMHKGKFKQLPTYIRAMADSIRLSEGENYKVWGPIYNPNGNQNGDQNMTFQEAVDAMIEAFNKRFDWIETKIGYYRNDINYH